MAQLSQATRIEPAAGGGFAAELDPEWTVGGRPHGGYLLALLGRAVLATAPGHPHPLSASAVYASSPAVGPAAISVELVRQGRFASQVRARLTQAGKVLIESHFVTGHLAADADERFTDAPPPLVPPIDECERLAVAPMGGNFLLPMLGRMSVCISKASFLDGRADLRGWLANDADAPFDPLSLLFAADAFPPPTLTLGSVGWVPTLELTVYLRAVPAPGPLRVRQRSRVLAGGLVDVVCEAWDSRDRVVLQATQLAAVRMG